MTKPLKDLSISIQTFEKLRESNFIYVDKTQYMYELVRKDAAYFLSRPRRFGKSLLVSTLEAIFQGRRELFEDLAISKTDYAWPVHPIIRLDFSKISSDSANDLRQDLLWTLDRIAASYNIDLSSAVSIKTKLTLFTEELSQKNNKVVFLIDEYDKPILDHIGNLDVAREVQQVLKSFYETIKALDEHIKFIFLTGISKFTKTAVFSALNNLNDISESARYAHLLGYTQAEIEHYFEDYLEQAAKHLGMTVKQLLVEMKDWYNGYQFCTEQSLERIYSPLSVMYCLENKDFKNYWFTTGTPGHLVELIKKRTYDLSSLELLGTKAVSDSIFGQFDISNVPLNPLLYQAGYLTIHSYDSKYRVVNVAFPNKEVRDSMRSYLLAIALDIDEGSIPPIIREVDLALEGNDIARLCAAFQIIIATIPHPLHLEQEAYYHTILHMLFLSLGKQIHSEVFTSKGRIDMIIVTGSRVFVFEFKFDKTAQEAMDQIMELRYFERYLGQGKPITLVGINFDYKDKAVLQYLTQELVGS